MISGIFFYKILKKCLCSGIGKYLKEKNPNIRILGVDAFGSVLKKYHETRVFDEKEIYPYITEGIGEDIIPKNIDFDIIDHLEKVADKDGALMARRLAREEGIMLGYSAGSALAGCATAGMSCAVDATSKPGSLN